MILRLLLLSFLLLGCPSKEKEEDNVQAQARDPFTAVSYVSNFDGDTITVNLPSNIPDVFSHEIPVRVRGIDTAEMTSSIQCERKMARIAKEVVAQLLTKAKRIDLEDVGRDKYFRLLAGVTVYRTDNSRVDVGEFLLKKGLATLYDGGTKLKVSWCRMLKQHKD